MKIKQIQLTKFLDAQTQEERQAIELNPLTVFHRALQNCTPILELTPIKRSGQTYQVKS
jgi:small subunit ribosomal protein S7